MALKSMDKWDTAESDEDMNGPKRSRLKGFRKYPWGTMRVKDHFVFPRDVSEGCARNLSSRASKRLGRKFEVNKSGKDLVCWRTK